MTSNTTNAQRAVFNGVDAAEPLRIQDNCAFPDLQESEILGKIRLATVCGSDLHTYQGTRKERTPSILGHEGVIEVVESKRKGVIKGQRLSFAIIDCCVGEKCQFCSVGLEQKCVNLFKYGHALLDFKSPLNGCFASHIVIHAGTHVVPIPDDLPDKVVAPANCACATVVHAISTLFPRVKEVALVQGAGLLGLYACAILKEYGYSRVFCCDVDANRLANVKNFGGIPIQDNNAYTKSNFYDLIVEVCGVSSVVPKGIQSIKTGGTYLLIGLVHPKSQMDITGEQIIRKCLTVRGIHNYRPQDLDGAIAFLHRNRDKYPFESLVGPPFKLQDLALAFSDAAKGIYARVSVVASTK